MKDACSKGIKEGMKLCIDILIPSTFPFLVMSSFIVKSGLSLKMGKFLDNITNFFFSLPGCCAPTIILGLIGGYPAGARGIKSLYDSKQISKTQAEHMLSFVVGAGPSFVITAVGSVLLKSSTAGIILFLSQIISAVLIGIISKLLFYEKNYKTDYSLGKIKPAYNNITASIVESVIDTTYSMINMCAFVVIFSCILSMINESNFFNLLKSTLVNLQVPSNICECIIPMILEVTSGCCFCVKERLPIEFLSFTLGFAGICVHFQIFSILSSLNISKIKFLAFRLIHGCLSAIATYFIFSLVPIEKPVISNITKNLSLSNSSDFYGTILLILLCICFLVSISKAKIFNKDSLPLNR